MDDVEQLFKQYYGFVCNIIHGYIKDRSKTEDIAQEMFMELWVKRAQLQIHTSTSAYLRRMAVTRTLNYIRDAKKHQWEDLEVFQSQESGRAEQDAEVIRKLEETELKVRINQALEALPEKCRLVFLLSRQEEMSYAEIAGHLGISIKTVENQIGKALKLLRLSVGKHGG